MCPQIIKKSPELKDHYSPSLIPILIQINTVRIFQSCFIRTNVNVIITYRPGSSKWTLILHFSPPKILWIFLVLRVCHIPANSNHTVAVTLYFREAFEQNIFHLSLQYNTLPFAWCYCHLYGGILFKSRQWNLAIY